MADPPPPPDRSLWERYRVFASRFGGRFRLSVAFGIVIVSILAATMAWRASVWSERSANTDELSRQDVVLREQLLSSQAEAINQDVRVFGVFEEATLLSQELLRSARQAPSAEEKQRLRLEAGSKRAEAKAQRRFFTASQPVVDANTKQVNYDPGFAARILRAYDVELEVLRPDALREDARVAHIKAVRLTGLAALFVAALLFLTLAEVTRQGVSRWFATAGVATATVALALFFFAI